MTQQQSLMKFDPSFGTERPYPSHAQQWRDYHGNMAWLFNPWTEGKRHPSDIGSDTFGLLIVPDGEPVFADKELTGWPLAQRPGSGSAPEAIAWSP